MGEKCYSRASRANEALEYAVRTVLVLFASGRLEYRTREFCVRHDVEASATKIRRARASRP